VGKIRVSEKARESLRGRGFRGGVSDRSDLGLGCKWELKRKELIVAVDQNDQRPGLKGEAGRVRLVGSGAG